jgi:hypothetical protein
MKKRTCAELVALVNANGAEALDGMEWLDEIVDIDGAAEFTRLKTMAVRSYHGQARRKRTELAALPARERKKAEPSWMWPEPDLMLAGHAGWKLRTLVLSRAAMPGRGAGGGRPWPSRNAG